MECSNPCFTLELENTGEGWWLNGRNEHGHFIFSEIVEDDQMPFLNTPIEQAIRMAVPASLEQPTTAIDGRAVA